jgi:acetyl-CoA carboxylase biotin carboxyl carrier protein
MNVDFLQQLVNLMASNDLNTVDLRDSDRRIVLKRGVAQVVAGPVAQAPVYAAPAAHTPTPSGASGGSAAAPADESAGLVAIKSPMVGTFYAAPSPDAKPFVQVGSNVDDETDVCVIEAMKVFNNIKAETRGTIAKVMVTNGQTVEFGTVLFLVKPA